MLLANAVASSLSGNSKARCRHDMGHTSRLSVILHQVNHLNRRPQNKDRDVLV